MAIIIDGYISDDFNRITRSRRPAAAADAPAPVQHDLFWATAQDKPRRFSSVNTDINRQAQREETAKAPKIDHPSSRGGGIYIII